MKFFQKLDRNQYVREDGLLMSDSEVRTMLKDVYRTIATNGANKVLDGRKSISPVGGRSKMANRQKRPVPFISKTVIHGLSIRPNLYLQ